MKLTAKCTNFNGCLLAYRSEDILLDDHAPLICPECEKVLSLVPPQSPQASSRFLLYSGAVLLVLGISAGVLFWKPAPPRVAFSPEIPALPPSSPTSPTPAPAPHPSEMPTAPIVSAATPKPSPEPVTPVPDVPASPAQQPPSDPTPPPAPIKPPEHRDPVTEKYRALLLEKTDQLQSLSLEARESLIASLEATHKISKLATVPVQFGIQKLPPSALSLLKPALESNEVRGLLEKSPGPVFVVLGYADGSGDPSKNLAASQSRADLIGSALREKLPKKAPVYSIAMGSTHLPAPEKFEENRVAEVWLVLP